jgi:hypothetical protein
MNSLRAVPSADGKKTLADAGRPKKESSDGFSNEVLDRLGAQFGLLAGDVHTTVEVGDATADTTPFVEVEMEVPVEETH